MATAVTFDLWDTLIIDDSDEPVRAARALPTKRETRRRLLHAALHAETPIAYETVALAYDVADAAFNKVWHDQLVTWTVRERLGVLLAGLGRTLPEPALATLVRQHEDMELDPRPRFADGAVEAVRTLARSYKLAVISDAIFSPGRALRELLAGAGILDAFSAFVFSDEIGVSKPDPAAFVAAAKGLGVAVGDLVHVGDREHNDIAGAQRAGARAILITAIKDRRGGAQTAADAICTSHAELPGLVDRLAAAR